MILDDDDYTRALHARAHLPAALFWAMLKSHLYLGAGFVSASVAAVALGLLVKAEPGRLTPLELTLAAVLGVAFTAYAWNRASGVLEPVANEGHDAADKVRISQPRAVLLSGFPRG